MPLSCVGMRLVHVSECIVHMVLCVACPGCAYPLRTEAENESKERKGASHSLTSLPSDERISSHMHAQYCLCPHICVVSVNS